MTTYTATPVQTYQLKPLERMDMARDGNSIVNQVHHMLLVDDDEIYEDDGDDEDEDEDEDEQHQDEDFSNLPTSSNAMNLSITGSMSSAFSHIQYVDSIRKNRPLPQIPNRTSSKELPSGMNATLNESLKNKPRLSAKELFHMLDQRNGQEEQDDEVDTSDDDIEYGGVYALKTQVATLRLSNKEVLKKYYDELNQNYKTMAPVEEVDEEQLLEDSTPNDTLEQTTRPVSQISLQAPSLASGRSSPASCYSVQSVNLDFDSKIPTNQANTANEQPNQPQQKSDAIHDVSSLHTTANDGHIYGTPLSEISCGPNQGTIHHVDDVTNRFSLYDDVQKLAQLHQASMTPEIPNSPIYSAAPTYQQFSHHNQYTVTPDDLRTSVTSASLVHDKESMKTYRRMVSKTKDRNTQFIYAKYLMQLVALDVGSTDPSVVATRGRLQEEAEFWVDKLAKSDFPAALYTKGQWHRHCCDSKAIGIFVGAQYKKVNHAKAFKCFQKAAKHGSVEAYYELAEYWMVRKDYKKTMESYRYAASKEHILSLYKLANILLRGLLDQQKNIQEGLVYLRQAADSEEADCARSAYDLGCIFSNDLKSLDLENEPSITNDYIKPNAELAVHYFKKASKFGLVNATFRLGQIYKQGQQHGQAYQCFAKAAEHNNESAMLELAYFYRDGISGYLSPQPLLAFQWCLKATENGNAVADYTLGSLYENGTGVYPDHEAAQKWFQRSASKGYGPANDKLRIQRKSSGQQIHHQKPHQEHNYTN